MWMMPDAGWSLAAEVICPIAGAEAYLKRFSFLRRRTGEL